MEKMVPLLIIFVPNRALAPKFDFGNKTSAARL
jgi:hypothetical protein